MRNIIQVLCVVFRIIPQNYYPGMPAPRVPNPANPPDCKIRRQRFIGGVICAIDPGDCIHGDSGATIHFGIGSVISGDRDAGIHVGRGASNPDTAAVKGAEQSIKLHSAG